MIILIILVFLSLFTHSVDSQCSLCTMPNGQCTTNGIQGILCEECNYRGYVDPVTRTCVCNSRFENPSVNCSSLYSVPIIVNVTTVVTNYHCDCHHNTEDGDWKLNEPPFESRIFVNSSDFKEFKYGLPYPPVCNTCFNRYIGPPPESLTPSMTSFKVQACTRIGGMDPNVIYRYKDITQGPDSPYIQVDYESFIFYPRNLDVEEDEPVFTWYECSNHGVWDPVLHVCVCNKGWGLALLPEKGFGGKDLYTCEVCAGPYGYKVPSQQYLVQKGNDFCTAPFTPDPVDGGTKICSGHGDFQLGECRCYDNSTHGHWTLANYTTQELTVLGVGDMTYEEVDVTYTVLTCLECKPPYSPDSFCMDATDSPSHSPTQTPTTKEPTRPPTRGPTLAPTTPIPTEEPTRQPTDSPTRPPSKGPTKDPTPLPSRLPTQDPTHSPTHDPTNNPSKNPSTSPTKNPTHLPTTDPTRPPSINPTHSPTNPPTHEPTRSPSKPPSTSPTRPPSTHPSRNPSLSPTHEPTRLPTELPTRSPTSSPTSSPSKTPTKAPTDEPTLAPSPSPTKLPTLSPTVSPTKNPTKDPTPSPTLSPSKSPTKAPTPPTSSPTKSPSRSPTRSPTVGTPGIIWFYSGANSNGNIGNAATTDAICAARATSLGLQCRVVIANLGYSSRAVTSYASTYGIPTTTPVTGPTGIPICTYNQCYGGSTLTNSLVTAGVIPSASPTNAWVGAPFINCIDFISSVPTGYSGDGSSTASSWYPISSACSNVFPWYCSCIQGTSMPTQTPTTRSPTKAPTRPPTNNPTQTPTTVSPTKAPTRPPTQNPTRNPTNAPTTNPTVLGVIRVFPSATTQGNLGGSTTAVDAACASLIATNWPSVTVIRAFAMVSFSTRSLQDLPTVMEFSTSSPMKVTDTSTTLATTWQTGVGSSLSSAILVTLNTFVTGVSQVWMGNGFSPSATSANCNNWSTTSNGASNLVGSVTATNFEWLADQGGGKTCDQNYKYLCGALTAT